MTWAIVSFKKQIKNREALPELLDLTDIAVGNVDLFILVYPNKDSKHVFYIKRATDLHAAGRRPQILYDVFRTIPYMYIVESDYGLLGY
jgi:hypothetical protein